MEDINKMHNFTKIFFFVAIILMIIMIFYIIKKSIKHEKDRKNITLNNKYINSNREKIEKIVDENLEGIDSYKSKILLSVIILIICIILCFYFKNKILTYVLIFIPLVFLGINIYCYSDKKNDIYNIVINKILDDYDSDFDYNVNGGFTKSEYNICHFPERCDRFHSEDMISNLKKGFYYADILIESEHEDSDGDTHTITEYSGSLAKMNIKDINCEIYLGGMKTSWFSDKKYINIEFENDEFNKLFVAYSDNELQAYKVLTPDIMEQFVELKKNSYGDIDIRIIHDKLYIRFLSGDGFTKSFNKNVEKEKIMESIAVFQEALKVMEKVKEIIEKKMFD